MIEFRELSDRADDLLILEKFCDGLYASEFPDVNERESLANMKEYLRLRAQGWYGDNNYHVLIALQDGEICGGAISDFLAEANAGAIEFLVVGQPMRGTGLGHSLLQRTEQALANDAKLIGKQLSCVVAEMNDPFKAGSIDDCFDPFARATIWEKWGYARLDFPYLQPALSRHQSAVSNLMLAAKSLQAEWRDAIPSHEVRTILAQYMRWAMRLDKPDDVSEYRQASAFLDRSPTVGLVPLGAYVGRDAALPISIKEVTDASDPDLDRVVAVYRSAFPGGPSDLSPEDLRRALTRPRAKAARYHLWAVQAATAAPIDGVASFFTFAAAGFGGYVALRGSLRGTRRLSLLLARIEEQMVWDRTGARGWYIECKSAHEALFKKMGFYTVDIDYRQPPLGVPTIVAESPSLCLMYKEFGRQFAQPSLSGADLLAAMRNILADVYLIDAPDMSPFYGHVQRQVACFDSGMVRFR